MRPLKYICAAIGGVLGFILSLNISGYLTRLKIDFSQVNFAVIPFVFIAMDLTLYAVHAWRWTKKQPKIRDWCVSSIAHGFVGAVWGLSFGYFTQLDIFWCIIGFTIVYAIPYASIISTFVSVPLFWWMCWDKYTVEYSHWTWSGWKTESVWTIPQSMEWVRAPLFVYFLVAPFFALLGYKVGAELPSLRSELISSWRRERAKWIGAFIGGLICLLWSIFPIILVLLGQYALFLSVLKVYSKINFFIMPFYVYAICFLSVDLVDPFYEKFSKVYIIINGCGGALAGIYISGLARLDPSFVPWCIIISTIVGAIPMLGLFFIFFGGLLPLIYFVVQNWHIEISLPTTPFTPTFSQLLLLAAPSLLAIPGSAFFGYEAGGFIGDKLKKARLKLIEKQIKNLDEIIKKHQTVLDQRNQLERSIDRIIAVDPPNFRFKVTLFSKQAKGLNNDDIRKRIIEIEGEIQRRNQLRNQAEEKLDALESEKMALERRLEVIRNRLHILEAVDPANIKIKMQKLQAEWKGIRREELETIEATGELETLFKEHLLLNFQIKEKASEIENQRKEIAYLNLTEDALQLEKHVLELEIMDRKIKDEEPRLFELKDKLSNLQIKRDKIKQSLQ